VCHHRDIFLHHLHSWSQAECSEERLPNTFSADHFLWCPGRFFSQCRPARPLLELPVSVRVWTISGLAIMLWWAHHRLLELMAEATHVLHLGLVHMRPLVNETQGHSPILVSFQSAESIAQLSWCSLEVERPSFCFKESRWVWSATLMLSRQRHNARAALVAHKLPRVVIRLPGSLPLGPDGLSF